MTRPFKYSIIIPTYNHCDDLLKPCVDTVLAYSRMTDVELVISANGCVDSTLAYTQELKQKFEQLGFGDHLKVVWHDQALGFSRAVNEGIKASTGQRIILLNNDVVLLHQDRNCWLDRLNAPFEQSDRVGITTTLKLYSAQVGRQFAVFFCTMIDRKVIDTLGLLNEEYGVGAGEDTEYCIKAEMAGFEVHGVAKTYYEPSIGTNASDFPIWHKAEGTMHDPELVPNWSELFAQNGRLLTQKWAPECVAHTLPELCDKFPTMHTQDADSLAQRQDVWHNNSYQIHVPHMHNKEVIDIGAGVGVFTLAAAALGAYRVWAYEPTWSSYNQLEQNVSHMALNHKVVLNKLIVQGAPSDPQVLSVHDRHGQNSIYRTHTQSEIVPTISFADIMAQTYSHDVIVKINCEGSEFDIILDSDAHTWRRVSVIHLRITEQLHVTHKLRAPIHEKLISMGFTMQSSTNIGTNWFDQSGQFVKWEPGVHFVESWRR